MADSCVYLDNLEVTNDVNNSEKSFFGLTRNCFERAESKVDAPGDTVLHTENTIKESEHNPNDYVKDGDLGKMSYNYDLIPVSPDGEINEHEGDRSDVKDLIEQDVKLKLGCFIKLVNCQALLKSMIEVSESDPKNKKRKHNENSNNKKSKVKKHKMNEQKKNLGQKSKANKSHDRKTSFDFDASGGKASSLSEDKNNSKVFKNACEESNIFSNMSSFLKSSTSSAENLQDSSEGHTNAVEKVANHRPITNLRPAENSQPDGKDDSYERNDSDSQLQSHKADDPAKDYEKIKKKNILEFSSDDGSSSESPIIKEEKLKHKKHKKDKLKKVKNKFKKSKLKFSPEKESRKSISFEYKRMKADEALQKLQDAISIKPNASLGSVSTMRIPKINQNSSGCTSSKISSDMERRKILTVESESSEIGLNRLKDAGWTTFSRPDQKSGNGAPPPSVPARNPNRDHGHRKRDNFETLRQSPADYERSTYREDRSPVRSTTNGGYDYRNNPRYKESYRSMEKKSQFRSDSGRNEGFQRPPLLPSPQNYNSISCDIQFLLKACNAIVDKNSNFSSDHRRQFNSACSRLREELERLIHSSAPLHSPGSRHVPSSSAFSSTDPNCEDVMSVLKSFLPHDVFDKISKDVSKLNLFGERFRPISPQSSTSSTSHLSPKHYHAPPKDFSRGRSFDGSRGDGRMPNKQQLMEERLVKKIENEMQILETLIKVQDQLSIDLEKTSQVSNTDNPIPPSEPKSNPPSQSSIKNATETVTTIKSPGLNESEHALTPPEKSQELTKECQPSSDKDKDKKTEEEIVNLCRNALKSYYQKGSITTEEFKTIMKKAIAKISESKCKDISQPKVSRFIDSLVSNVTSRRKKLKT